MRWISKRINRTRTFRVSILTLFLSLTIISFAAVISFTYSRNFKQIYLTSKEVAQRLNQLILEKLTDIAQSSERITQMTNGFYFELGEVSYENTLLKSFMLNVLKNDPQFSNFYIGLNNGSFLGVLNLAAASQKTYIREPQKMLPSKTMYAVEYVNWQTEPSSDTWYYLDENFNVLDDERIVPADYDTLHRPWYVSAKNAKGLFWTSVYSFFPIKEHGISIANPIYDQNGVLLAVVGADLTLVQLDRFIRDQVIGKTGRAYIVDSNGTIIIPRNTSPQGLSSLVPEVMRWHELNPKRPDFVFRSKGTRYLAYVSPIPVPFEKDWRIVIVAPLRDFFGEMIKIQRDVILIIVGILIISSLIIAYFAKKISEPIVTLSAEIHKIRHLDLNSEVDVKSNIKEISMIDAAITAMRKALRSFARYVPKEVVKDLFVKGEEINLGGEKKEVTIFFSDISGFTAIAEALPIDVLIPLLSEYFDVMTKIIQESHGIIDKFLGDGIMAFWGAPLNIPDHAVRACTTALHCKAEMLKLNERRRQENKPEFKTRFGINTGTVIVGNFGSSDRMNYTVIGDAVNLTARLQEIDKFYHTAIIISEDVYKNVGDAFLARPLDVVNVKGKKEKVKIYELIAQRKGDPDVLATPEQIEFCATFSEAYEAFMHKDYSKARSLFQAILTKFPNDFPAHFYLRRIDDNQSHS